MNREVKVDMRKEKQARSSSFQTALRKALWLAGGCAFVGVSFAPRSYAQLGIDTAAILAGLSQINSTMQSVMQAPMQALQSAQNDMQQYEQQVMYPLSGIQQAQALAQQTLTISRQMQSLMNIPVSSATLPVNIQFESSMLSGDPNQLVNIQGLFQSAYGSLPTTAQANQDTIGTVDAGDAIAQECIKKAIQLDALSEQEMAVSQQLLTQLQTSAPGNAPIVSAQAAAWILQGHGYTQSALAQILRANAAQAGYQGFELKQGGADNQKSISAASSLTQAASSLLTGVTANSVQVKGAR
jgi:hypothetical protein